MSSLERGERFNFEAEYHSLRVVDDGELKGIVTTTDIIKYMLDQY